MSSLSHDRSDRNARLRTYHFHRPNAQRRWMLIGSDGHETTERDTGLVTQHQVRSSPVSSQQWADQMPEDQALVLDSATTDLNDLAEIIELALVELDGTMYLNTLMRASAPFQQTPLVFMTSQKIWEPPQFHFPPLGATAAPLSRSSNRDLQRSLCRPQLDTQSPCPGRIQTA